MVHVLVGSLVQYSRAVADMQLKRTVETAGVEHGVVAD
jgi:hypothetical protein